MNEKKSLVFGIRIVILLMFAGSIAFAGEGKRLVAREDFKASKDWELKKTCGKDFWYLRRPYKWEYVAGKDGYNLILRDNLLDQEHWRSTDLFQDSGYFLSILPWKELSFRLCVREIELFSGERAENIALQAKPFSECSESEIKKVNAINDGKDTNFSYSSLTSSLPLAGSFGLEFSSSQKISRAVIHLGFHDGKKRYAFVADHFVLQVKDKGNWKNIPGTEVKDNRLAKCELKFGPVEVKKIRLFMFSETDSKCFTFGDYFPQNRPFYLGEKGVRLEGFAVMRDREKLDPWVERVFSALDFANDKRCLGFVSGEWDNDFYNCAFLPGSFGVLAERNPERLARMKELIPTPTRPQEVMDILQRVFEGMQKRVHGKIFGLNCMEPIDHLGLEWGGTMSCIELYGLATSADWQIAFARGAARQYQAPWMCYLTWYLGHGNRSYRPRGKKISGAHNAEVDWTNFNGDYPSGHCVGMSVSLNKRLLYLSYLCGMNFLTHEQTPFYQDLESTGKLHLSKPGEMTFEWYDFVKRHPDRGVLYTPIAILLDFNHGFTPFIDRFGEVTFTKFPYKNGDWMISKVTHDIFPHVQYGGSMEQDDFYLTNATPKKPYSNIFDVLLPNPPSGVLSAERMSAYKVLYPLGDIKIDAKLAAELKKYVKSGGTLLLNSKQVVPDFDSKFLGLKLTGKRSSASKVRYLTENKEVKCPEYGFVLLKTRTARVIADDGSGHPLATVSRYGKGNVIFTAPDYLLDKKNRLLPLGRYLLTRLTREVLPFEIRGNIGYTINRNDKGWMVGLFNNKGVFKTVMEYAIVDESMKSEVEIILPWEPEEVTELCQERKVETTSEGGKSKVQITVPAGDVKILQIAVKDK